MTMRVLAARILRALAEGARGLFTGVLALMILFEEWGWEPLQRALAWVGRLPVLRQIERGVTRLPPVPALAVLLLPSLLLLPTKLVALWLIAGGHPLLGATALVLAKLVGTALVARLFKLTRPALLRMAWFAHLYHRWVPWKDALLAQVRASQVWRVARALKQAARRRWARWRASFIR